MLPGSSSLGKINDQTLLVCNAGAGRWLAFSPESSRLRGVALAAELHYATTVQEADSHTINYGFQTVTLSNPSNRSDSLNATFGVQVLYGDTTFRFGFVQPLKSGDDRFFDHELNFQVNRMF